MCYTYIHCNCSIKWFTLGFGSKKVGGSKNTLEWTLFLGSKLDPSLKIGSQTRRLIFLIWDRQDLMRKWRHIRAVLHFVSYLGR
jgi:hypothetical protein